MSLDMREMQTKATMRCTTYLLKWLQIVLIKNRKDTKKDHYICCLQKINLELKDTYRLEVKAWKQIFHANGNQKKAGVAILISDKIDFKIKAVKREKDTTQ